VVPFGISARVYPASGRLELRICPQRLVMLNIIYLLFAEIKDILLLIVSGSTGNCVHVLTGLLCQH
jgi:hypothetical protein